MTKAKSSGLTGALREKALDFFDSEANVVTEFEGWQVAEASLFPDPRFRNAEELGEFARGQQFTRGGAEAPSRDALAEHQRKQCTFQCLSAVTRNAS